MGVGTKHRQQKTADACKQHLREKYADNLVLVEEFIAEFEAGDITRWVHFSDASRIEVAMLKRVNEHFEKWLNP
jgi:hypothetical protein